MYGVFYWRNSEKVHNESGIVLYNSTEEKYAVYVTVPGTYDSKIAGFICDKLDTLKIEGLSINFDGNYYSYDKTSPLGGLNYYNLDLSRFDIK